jgi:hypothetical protein
MSCELFHEHGITVLAFVRATGVGIYAIFYPWDPGFVEYGFTLFFINNHHKQELKYAEKNDRFSETNEDRYYFFLRYLPIFII